MLRRESRAAARRESDAAGAAGTPRAPAHLSAVCITVGETLSQRPAVHGRQCHVLVSG